jgi:succinate dehydrogenase / fumarate reductase iron-sulfur subunit
MKVTFRIFRYNPEVDDRPYYKDYTIDVEPKTRIIDALHYIKYEIDGTLTFRRSCLHGICGSDGMRIDGKNRLACSVLLKDLGYKDEGRSYRKPVLIEPLPGMPIIKDLVTDFTDFWKKYEVVKPYLINRTPPPERERRQSPEDAELISESSKCILCACCTTSCPSTWSNDNYLGPAALLKAYRFIFDTRDEATDERLDLIDIPDGIWRCHTIFHCIEACPKEINITWHLSQLKKKLVEREL